MTKRSETHSQKGQHLQKIMLVTLDSYIWKNQNRSIFITLHKTPLQLDQELQHKTRYTVPDEREMGPCFDLIDTGKGFLDRIPRVEAIRSTIIQWDLRKLKTFCVATGTVIWTKLQNEKRFFSTYILNGGLKSKII